MISYIKYILFALLILHFGTCLLFYNNTYISTYLIFCLNEYLSYIWYIYVIYLIIYISIFIIKIILLYNIKKIYKIINYNLLIYIKILIALKAYNFFLTGILIDGNFSRISLLYSLLFMIFSLIFYNKYKNKYKYLYLLIILIIIYSFCLSLLNNTILFYYNIYILLLIDIYLVIYNNKIFKIIIANKLYINIIILFLSSFMLLFLKFWLLQNDYVSPRIDLVYGTSNPIYHTIKTHQIYDIKYSAYNNSLYFSEKLDGIIGRLHVPTDEISFSGQFFKGTEQLVLINDKKMIATNSNAYGPVRVSVVDAITLNPNYYCPNLQFFNDLVEAPSHKFLGAVENGINNFYLININNCSKTTIDTNTSNPYQILCSKLLNKCYIDGWTLSGTLSEISFDEKGYPIASRGLYIGPFSLGMAFDKNDERLFIARPIIGMIDVISTETFKRISRIPCAKLVRPVVYIPDMDFLIAVSFYSGQADVIHVKTQKVIAKFFVGTTVRDVIWVKEFETIYFAAQNHIAALSKHNLILMIEEQADQNWLKSYSYLLH